MIKDYRPE